MAVNRERQNLPLPETNIDGQTTLLSLPPEVQHLIASELPYPDLLSLKISHPYFGALLDAQPSVHQRIAWVLSRCNIYLPIPHDSKTDFRTDVQFLRNPEVTRIIRRRRKHLECVECKLARQIVWLKSTSTDDERRRRLCFVNEGYECPRVRELDEKKMSDEKKIGRRLLKLVGWPNAYWESGSSYWEHRGLGPPAWFIRLTWWFAPVDAPPIGIHVPTLIMNLIILILLVAGMIGWQAGCLTLSGLLESVSRSSWQWLDAMWKDWLRELHLPV
ncbi:uncharacterized protein A1O9_11601 [Exophiala aquamarina CBS 119918]|uniref:F-box domain-containing protein n=1 Tax=Exophiala aquamarina CBS 119918 TaxID=1182545 RepID=A0A072P9Z0_9EURO|nr:uncharacterized protein A1O9_11601 [Exophiala aquamarina CBS 119918]KEF52360.1 hypothetical protein A1O9_11601 [Exophiala aquamarina CBS 119918]